jgi:hypothetical protein
MEIRIGIVLYHGKAIGNAIKVAEFWKNIKSKKII